ncbi:DUF2130 domain-containing protein [Winogradskyella sp. UBA3174]|uniref:DUF2130 domain-containing protein n=1 Tax=Winogradskyella sp. UBA3174 TaxID=1947785 RepID=UPI0025DF5EAE|nr:DUF2130 domain-containing protein [Winogradskyella sp. UBA3174]|tara:strand:- start:129707 stop:130963 length:1257 start_codon:yes stop_codon:yes gene_type:complete
MKSKIACPNCGENIDVNDVLKHQLEDSIRKEYAVKEIGARKIIEKHKEALDKEKADFLESKQQTEDEFQKRLQEKLKASLLIKEAALKEKISSENADQLEALNKELNEKSEKLKELNKSKAEIERLKREKNEMEETIKAEQEKAFNAKLQEERDKIKKQAEDSNELKIKEFEKKLADQKRLMEEMQRKHEQGSMQLQGEVLELAIEEWLAREFPLDTIDEIKKGANGADCLQIVNTRELQNCGTIYYESKRTKAFQPAWIEKFKNDIREKNANIGVLVTEVMPSDMDRMGLRNGIWICTFEEFKGLCAVLRQSIVQWSRVKLNQENKGDKMEMLYDFLTSNEFRLQMEGVVEGFTQMDIDLQKEKTAMKSIWKKRDKQIERVRANAIAMHGSIKGIAGNAIQSIPALELEIEGELLIE